MIAGPIVRWAGGKRSLLRELGARVPQTFGRYYEPFAGGAALFFDLKPKDAVLSDANPDLIATYRAIAAGAQEVAAALKRHAVIRAASDPAVHYRMIRDRWNAREADEPHERAALFLYLNRCCFNGLWRVNRLGEFNVPYGKLENPLSDSYLATVAVAGPVLSRAVLRTGDFESAVADAEPGDLVYFDPPYVPLSKTAEFRGYVVGGFDGGDQERLADCALHLVQRGVHVLASNSGAPLARSIWGARGFMVDDISAPRSIAANKGSRTAVKEIIASSPGCRPPVVP